VGNAPVAADKSLVFRHFLVRSAFLPGHVMESLKLGDGTGSAASGSGSDLLVNPDY